MYVIHYFTYEIRIAFHVYLESLIQRARRQAKAVRTTESGGAQFEMKPCNKFASKEHKEDNDLVGRTGHG